MYGIEEPKKHNILDDLEALRHRAAEAVINANVDPAALTPEQHQDVDALQTLAAHATSEANLALIASPAEASVRDQQLATG